VLAITVVLAVALAALGAVLTMRLSNAHAEQTARPAILSAAVGAVTATASYDWQALQADERAAETRLTEPLRSAYAARVAQQVSPLAAKYHAVSKATVAPDSAGIVTQTTSTATVLLYVDQVVTNTQLSAPRLDQTRVLATMREVGGRWLMSDLKTL
jgi:Mce-associated membrane protein